jgi:hypothetical protein
MYDRFFLRVGLYFTFVFLLVSLFIEAENSYFMATAEDEAGIRQ